MSTVRRAVGSTGLQAGVLAAAATELFATIARVAEAIRYKRDCRPFG
jgi:hypothetical protein